MLAAKRFGPSLAVVFLGVGLVHGADVGTAFTYRGRLVKDGSPVTNTCDFTFGFFDAPTGGSPAGNSPQGAMDVPVTNGLFAVNIDFGPAGIDGTARWLEITVKCLDDGDSVLLSPRVELTPVPHALSLPGLYTQQNATSPNLIGGYSGNSAVGDIVGATIGGGGSSGAINSVSGNYGTVGGGNTNTAIGMGSLIGGGLNNSAAGWGSVVGGGQENSASFDWSIAAGGYGNTASSVFATVGGGMSNTANGESQFYSNSTATVGVQLVAGANSWSAMSDRNVKEKT